MSCRQVLATLALIAPFAANAAEAVPSHCTEGEKPIFSCRMATGEKVLSLCAADNLGVGAGHLQYRFGAPGAIELEFPKVKGGSVQRFKYAHYMRYRMDLTEVTFSNGGVTYALFDHYNGEESPSRISGVRVKDKDLLCRQPLETRMMTLEGILRCDERNSVGAVCPEPGSGQ